MNPIEEDLLRAKLEEILHTSYVTREAAINAMTEVIISSYREGIQRGLPNLQVDPLLTERSIAAAVDSMAARTGQIWDQMDFAIINTIATGIEKGKSYDAVTADIDTLIRDGFGETVHFDNRGRKIRDVKINPDGSMEWYEHTIRRRKTMTTEDYADDISRTTVHESWNQAKDDQFKSLDIPGWIYNAILDGATRPTHLALHGKVIMYGTAEEEMAKKVQSDYRCRCTRIPYYDDPDFDDPPEKYERQKQEAARLARENQEDGSATAAFLDKIIGEDTPKEEPPRKSPAESPFYQAKSMKDMRQIIKDRWNPDMLFGEKFDTLSLPTARASFHAIDEVMQDFEGINKHLLAIDTKTKRGTYASVTDLGQHDTVLRGKSLLTLCTNVYGKANMHKFIYYLTRDIKHNYHPDGPLASVAVHEMGHAVLIALAHKIREGNMYTAGKVVKTAAKRILKREPNTSELEDLRVSISGYAKKNSHETVAEAFADYYANRENANPLSLEIVKVVKEMWTE